MKKINSLMIVLCVFVGLMGVLPISASGETDSYGRCTMAVIGKSGTADGSIIIWHNEELSPKTAQRLVIRPRETHEPGDMRACGFEMIPQVPVTYRHIGDLYWPGGYPPGDWCTGLNEFGVTLISNAQNSKEEALPPNTGVSFCDVTEVPMERATTAQQAVEVLGGLIDTYGMAGAWADSCWVVADQNEAWYVEGSLRHWVARRVGDDEILPITNRYLIGTEWDLASDDLIEYAVAQGWYVPTGGEPFSWKDVYGVPSTQNSPRLINREARIIELLEPKWGAITPKDCLEAMRDHYGDTDMYSYPPHEASGAIKPICSSSSCFGVVYHMRSWLPTEIGALMWYRMAASCSGVSIPIYAGTTEFPEVYTMENTDEYDPVSAWWHFKSLMDKVDEDYANLNPHVRKAWYRFEEKELKQTPQLEERALKAYESGNLQLMEKLLTRYTRTRLNVAYNLAEALNHWISE